MSTTRRTRIPASGLSSRKASTTYLKGGPSLEEEQSSNVAIGELLRKIESFAPHKDTFVSNLDASRYSQLESIRETAKYLKDKKCYKLLINKIHDVYDDDVQAGTVGAFFKGSFIGNNGGPCSKLAAGSFPRAPTPGWKECEKNVALLTQGKFQILTTNPNSNEMIVHVSKSESFAGFSDSVINKMKTMGVKKTTIVSEGETDWEHCASGDPESLSYSRYSASHRESEACDVTSHSEKTRHHHKKNKKKCDDGDWNYVAVAIIALIILAFFAAAFMWWRSRTPAAAPAAAVVTTETVTTHYGGPGYIHV